MRDMRRLMRRCNIPRQSNSAIRFSPVRFASPPLRRASAQMPCASGRRGFSRDALHFIDCGNRVSASAAQTMRMSPSTSATPPTAADLERLIPVWFTAATVLSGRGEAAFEAWQREQGAWTTLGERDPGSRGPQWSGGV